MAASQRTLWTGSGLALGAAGFVSALVLLQGVPSSGSATASRPAAQASAPASKPAAAAEPIRDERFIVKRILPIEGAIAYGEWHWDEAGAPADGATVITVDLKANVLSVFRDGHEIGATAVLTGHGGKPTPLGTFPITEKDADHVSNLYHSPMPFMLRMTNDGISIHGTKVENGYVTHGCIGVPEAFARKLFTTARLGDKVIVTDGATMKMGDSIV